ncbi:MAG: NAD(P)H-dependent oxidoreductase [Tabrizicola sp.]|nr:NAD(P)H-dependent oxidoreductase [Tabrizicola sp.]
MTSRPTSPCCLLVRAHPLTESLNARLATAVEGFARVAGWQVVVRDLYAEGFDPRLGSDERAGYYGGHPAKAVAGEQAELQAAEVLILVFPTWWSGFPAILKGWFDRVWSPGVAFDHAPDLGAMKPRLTGLQEVLVVTTLGSPAWIDWLILWLSQKRLFHWGILRPCAPRAMLRWMPFYRSETAGPDRVARFEARLQAAVKAMARRLNCPE